MAGELIYRDPTGLTGLTLYAVLRRGTQVWNGTAFEAEAAGHWATYALALPQSTGLPTYVGNMPAVPAYPLYVVAVHRQVGGSPALSDPQWGLQSPYRWNGVQEVSDWTQGSGLYALTFTVLDDLGAPVVGARVTAQNAAQTAVLAWGTTDQNGQLILLLDAGSYQVLVAAGPGYTAFPAQPLTVSANASVPYTLTRQVPTPPPTAGLCTVQFYVQKNGAPVVGATVAAVLENTGYTDGVLLAQQSAEDVTDSQGYAELLLVRQDQFTRGAKAGARGLYVFTVTASDQTVLERRRAAIPSQSSINFEDL